MVYFSHINRITTCKDVLTRYSTRFVYRNAHRIPEHGSVLPFIYKAWLFALQQQ